jgi:hypothetical protein
MYKEKSTISTPNLSKLLHSASSHGEGFLKTNKSYRVLGYIMHEADQDTDWFR